MSAATRPFVLLGNPENRRVGLFQQALEAQGQPPARVVSWLDFLREPARLAEAAGDEALFRIDSPGESFEVERALLGLGHEAAVAEGCSVVTPERLAAMTEDRGLILSPRQWMLGFQRALQQVEAVVSQRPGWRQLNPTRTILELFDKRRTSRRYAGAGLPVPEAVPGVTSLAELRAAMEERGWPAVFVKLASGSSASCLGILERGGGREGFFTTIEQAPTGWYNNLKPRRVMHPARVEQLVGFLLREGSQVEREVPKARLDDAFFDCRVLCIAGEPRFVVVRQNKHRITNLHLLGWRGDVEALREVVPDEAWEAAMDSCRRVAALHEGLHVGIDVLFEPGFGAHRIIEANAFGDLLPNLTRDGLSVYEWEIRAALAAPTPAPLRPTAAG